MKSLWFYFLLFISTCTSFPSRPLNERSTELTWQAWLLVDESRQNDLGMFRKRITPKSVFIAPTFSPDSLPACAEGYRSDTMGRCVKIIRINEDAHLDFLLQKLSEQFGEFGDYEEDEIVTPATPGPFQVNIPLDRHNDNNNKNNNNNEDYTKNVQEEEREDTEIAIVLTPRSEITTTTSTTTSTTTTTTTAATLIQNHTIIRNSTKIKNSKFNAENVAEILGVDPKDVETTTLNDLATKTTTTLITPTTILPLIETTTNSIVTETTTSLTTESTDTPTTTTLETTQTTVGTTKDFKETTTLEGEALFFQWRTTTTGPITTV